MSSEQKKRNLLVDVLGPFYISGEEQVFHCGYCDHHKKKLSVNIRKNKYKCWICEKSGNDNRRLIRRFGTRDQLHEWDTLTNRVNISDFDNLFEEEHEVQVEQILKLPEEFVSLVNDGVPYCSIGARKYLRERRVTKEDTHRWKIGYCSTGEYGGRIIVPSFNEEGRLNYFIGRSYADAFPKYKNPPVSKNIIFNHLNIDWSKELILVEGIFDAIVAGDNAIPILGSYLKEDGKLFQEVVKNNSIIYVALDPDMAQKTRKLVQKLVSYNIKVYKIDVLPYADIGEMTKEEFGARKEKASFLNESDYLLREAISSL